MRSERPIFQYSLAILCLFSICFGGAGYSNDGDAGSETVILALGDSLTVGYNLDPGDGFVPRLEAWLEEKTGAPHKVINGGVAGDTSSGGKSRLNWNLQEAKNGRPDLVIVELGANDALRGINPAITRQNISAIVSSLKDRDIPVLLAGMLAPPNLGADYAADFNKIYTDVAAESQIALYPFFLEGVAADPGLNLEDGMHPNADGIKVIVDNIGPHVLRVLRPEPAS